MTLMLQAAVVLAVVLSLLGAGWAVVLGYRFAKARREAAAAAAIDIYGSSLIDLTGFRGWLADLVDGNTSDGCASGSEHSSDMCADTSDSGAQSTD
ncbi:hypothetical protein FJV41_40555 [Myxococcus llanfairpwllgwyngyllgogerychwyrndrobwllllantysiliogogogochensis]|uniref:Uncharacterized protein n=1 Tax=Myxococcus llanfairpwllgwyngyllgogerychwyrndrobwllllantysiliogogogochensis TaxID=2590453 RepID=A0A540WMH1_9BACT|nr:MULTISPECIES: hypothetical protein [Myxococcus]NTX54808.1 hypothetical protein [Myxococcus sp. CA039A]TQF10216.1 hypothetical protein FJV41_40555 [Myxococcus llanfairpwllgwyngyllgogerychwyrndrobwllllantysiliogogogochensis]